jgi:hypothetical protein
MKSEEVVVEPMNVIFARTMEIVTWIGLILMIVPGLAYLVGGTGFVDVKSAVEHWNEPSSAFWEETKGIEIHGYSWFLSHLSYMDCLSIMGIVLLAVTSLVSMIAALPKADSRYKVILGILVLEFLFAIVRPLFMHVTGH